MTSTEAAILSLVDRIAYALWESDRETDPMFHASWRASAQDYRRRALVAVEIVTGTTP